MHGLRLAVAGQVRLEQQRLEMVAPALEAMAQLHQLAEQALPMQVAAALAHGILVAQHLAARVVAARVALILEALAAQEPLI